MGKFGDKMKVMPENNRPVTLLPENNRTAKEAVFTP
jgi:hypothetical protein